MNAIDWQAEEFERHRTHLRNALAFSQLGLDVRPALVNGAAGAVSFLNGEPFSVGAMTVGGGRIVEIDFLADPFRLRELDLTMLTD